MATEAQAAETAAKSAQVQEYIMHHVTNSHEWALPFIGTIHLPAFLPLHGVMVLIGALLMLIVFGTLYRKQDAVPRGLTNLLEVFVVFIRDTIAVPSLGEKDGHKMTPLFCSFFFFIMTLNLMGLIPLFSTATANVNVTAGLATITLGFMIFGTIFRNGMLGFVKCFVPHGIPVPVLFLLVPIEFVGMFIKAFALTIRLFANMLAGHIVIFSLLGLIVTFGWLALPSLGLAVGIYLLEVFIALLQAFIFTLLSAMFIGQMYHPAH
ncbi:MAG: F0F1 ATP synthase subunit A [Verrucomicrobia bacterium]|nr:F0F1 ATP synthase subunit A [Verrucomicrobiota bacterium]